MPDIEQQIAAKVAQQKAEDQAGRRAATEPLPGPLRDVFAIPQHIAVGQFKVRPFYDADFEILSLIGHPLHAMMTEGMEGRAPQANGNYIPRGPAAWELAWMMTRDVDAVEAKLAEGRDALKAAARQEFSRLQLGALVALNQAVMQQMSVYWSGVIGYGAAPAEGEKSAPPRK